MALGKARPRARQRPVPGPQTPCVASITATVTNNILKGTLAFPRATVPIGGIIQPDGSFKSGSFAGKFDGGSFTGSMTVPNGYCNPYRVTMKRSS